MISTRHKEASNFRHVKKKSRGAVKYISKWEII